MHRLFVLRLCVCVVLCRREAVCTHCVCVCVLCRREADLYSLCVCVCSL